MESRNRYRWKYTCGNQWALKEPRSTSADAPDVRRRILSAAQALIAEGGPDAATTRAVAARAKVQPPTIYRMFGDKRGLLDAVVEAVLSDYVAGKAARPRDPDPVEDLRAGWDLHIDFGLGHPGLFAILSGDLRPSSRAATAGDEVLRQRVRRIAQAGRLLVSESRAVAMIQAAGTGTVLTLLKMPEAERDLELSTATREAVIAAITTDAAAPTDRAPRALAAALRAALERTAVLSDGERHLLQELLDRIANGD